MSFIYSIFAILTGIICGIFTGLTPGIHVNTIASLIVAFLGSMAEQKLALPAALFIVTLSIAHSFFDYLPSLFLGVPTDAVYALLPGQKLVKEGKGGEALKLSIEGSWRGLIFSLIIALILTFTNILGFNFLGTIEDFITPFLFWILLAISILLILTEKHKLWALILFILSGIFGIVIFGTPLVPSGESVAFSSLFPALSGLFGLSGILLSITESNSKIPQQDEKIEIDLPEKEINKSIILGGIAGMAVGLLPGLGSANAATVTLLLTGNEKNENNRKSYIVNTSAIQAADAIFGIAALYLIAKSRSGASVAINVLLNDIQAGHIIIILITMAIAGWICRFLLLKTWQSFIQVINNVNYQALNLSILVFITGLVLATTGFWGVVILITGTSLGLLPPIVGVRRSQMMGLFLVPVMLFFSGLQAPIVTTLHLEAKLSPPIMESPNSIFFQLFINMVLAISSYILFLSFSRIKK